jgi:hypothetical protein
MLMTVAAFDRSLPVLLVTGGDPVLSGAVEQWKFGTFCGNEMAQLRAWEWSTFYSASREPLHAAHAGLTPPDQAASAFA